ncbi:S41 family peptidase [Thalassotalea euphylliae]|uniref:S41 family peptidase n=1 Tax=Thalassotalea euphylliae TaxID=1655234 RepID=UPI00362DD127
MNSITRFRLMAICLYLFGCVAIAQSISHEDITKLLDQTFSVMEQHYIEPSVVDETKNFIVARHAMGKYHDIDTLDKFAERIGGDIRDITGDKHLSLYTVSPEEEVSHIIQHREGKLTHNYAFEQVKVLPGNIGYLKFNKFHPDSNAKNTADSAFNFLANTEGMVIDLRDTIGGSPELVAHMIGYFLADRTPLWSTLDAQGNVTQTVQVDKHSGHTQFRDDYPVWLVTSHNSASATELFASALQANNKATVVGDATAGAGFYVGVRKITDELVFRISLLKPIISSNQSNWEKVGVEPDVKVPPVDALDSAIAIAMASQHVSES